MTATDTSKAKRPPFWRNIRVIRIALQILAVAFVVGAFLYLGTSFLLVALFTIVWYAAVELERTWIWWASGIVTGGVIIAIFAVFEKRREDVLEVVEGLKQWDP